RDHERASPPVVDAKRTDLALPGSGRQHDHSPPPRLAPCRERLGLKRPRLAPHAEALRELFVAPRSIFELEARTLELDHEIGVSHRRRAKARRATVPAKRLGHDTVRGTLELRGLEAPDGVV